MSNLPVRIVDVGGDVWYLCSDGMYEVNFLARGRNSGSASYNYIRNHIGIRKEIKS